MAQRYVKKEYVEKKQLDKKEFHISSEMKTQGNEKKSTGDTVQSSRNNKKRNLIRFDLCKICGKPLDENHKSNLIPEEEFEEIWKKKREESISYSQVLERDSKHLEVSKKIKESIKEEFYLQEEITGYRQGHHIISRKDIFFNENNKRLARIALSAGYDIDNLENGIILPTSLNRYKEDWRRDDKFRIMKATKMQLHSGHHNFDIELDSKVEMTSEQLRQIPKENYSVLVSDQVRKKIKKYENKCFLNEKEKEELICAFNQLSQSIKKDIEHFAYDKKGCHYYISRAALQYAFELKEERYKIIEVMTIKNPSNIIAKKYHLICNDSRIELKEKAEYNGLEDLNLNNFIKFCEDIEMFLYDGKLYLVEDKFILEDTNLIQDNFQDFKIDKNKQYSLKGIIDDVYSKREKRVVREIILARKKANII